MYAASLVRRALWRIYLAGSSVEGAQREAVTSRQGTAVGGQERVWKCCYAFRIAFGWAWHTSAPGSPCLPPTQCSGTVPKEHWVVRRAVQLNPMEEETFCLQGHCALSGLARAGSGTVWVSEPGVQALHCTYLHKAHSCEWRSSGSVLLKLGRSQPVDLEAQESPIS